MLRILLLVLVIKEKRVMFRLMSRIVVSTIMNKYLKSKKGRVVQPRRTLVKMMQTCPLKIKSAGLDEQLVKLIVIIAVLLKNAPNHTGEMRF